jgi:hypothetical protein
MLKKNLYLILFLLFATFSCAKKDPLTGKKVRIDPNAIRKAEKARDEGGSMVFGKKNAGESSALSLGKTNILWKATLNSLENIPISESDYAGGLIVTDWYGNGLKEGRTEDIKITVKFVSNELNASSIEVISHKRVCENSVCKTEKLNNQFSEKIKVNILNEVRNLKISKELNKSKKN